MFNKSIFFSFILFGIFFISCSEQNKKSNEISHSQDSTISRTEEYFTCPMHPQIVQDHSGTCPICAMDLVKKIRILKSDKNIIDQKLKEYYICPMHPQITQDHPGTCPICKMDLVKKMEDLSPTHSTMGLDEVNLTPEQINMINVGTSKVFTSNMLQEIPLYGTLEYKESSQYVISARVKGRVEKLYVNTTGASVRKGSPLFELYSPDIITTEQEYLTLLGSENLSNQAETIKQRLLLWGISQNQIEELKRSNKPTNLITIYSQYNGIVTKKSIIEGQYISEGTELFNVSDLNTLWMKGRIYDYELSLVKAGLSIELKTEAYPDKIFHGKISYIAPEIDQASRTIEIRSDINNQNTLLKPGMYCKTIIKIRLGKGIVIPTTALFSNGKENIVWIQKEAGKFIPKDIKLGPKVNIPESKESYYRVLEGLDENDQIVTSAGFLIDSESRIKAAAQIH
jgi:membrane fusion protein, copper/silver efflux system